MIAVSDDCYRCGACLPACPVPGTITNILAGKVRVNAFTCIGCEQCLPVCRFGYLSVIPDPAEAGVTQPQPPAPTPEPIPAPKQQKPRRKGR